MAGLYSSEQGLQDTSALAGSERPIALGQSSGIRRVAVSKISRVQARVAMLHWVAERVIGNRLKLIS